jgi:G3E family GTPase
VLRAKGFLWLATHHDNLILFSIAGSTLSVEPQGRWLAVDPVETPDEDTKEYIGKVWEVPFGDRRQEIVFIGAGMDRAALEARLNAALLSDEEMATSPQNWMRWEDLFAAMFADEAQV